MEDKEYQLEKIKTWLNFWQFLLGTIVIGFATTVVNWQIQWYQLQQEREKREQEYLAQFIEQALDENLAKRLRFAQYFSQLNLADDAKERWSSYYKDLLVEALGQKGRREIYIGQRQSLTDKGKLTPQESQALERINLKIQELEEDIPANTPIPAQSFEWNASLINAPITAGVSFTWGEATKNGARIPQNTDQVENIIKMAVELQKIEEKLKKPIVINSWFRDEASNRAVGGPRESWHLLGNAVDIRVEGYTAEELAQALDWWPGGIGTYTKSGIIHLDLRGYQVRYQADHQ